MLAEYARHFSTVEINTSFYGLPTAATLARWYEQVPPGFRFVLKAPRRITHELRLAGAADVTSLFLQRIAELGERLGPVLFQLPPSLKADLPRLSDFLDTLPTGLEAALEFRHPSWFADPVLELLARHRKALCVSDTDGSEPLVVPLGSFGYLRLRRDAYGPRDLALWAERILRQPWEAAFAYFKHEDAAAGPRYAKAFEAAVAARGAELGPPAAGRDLDGQAPA